MNARSVGGAELRTYLELVKFEHTLFALPFAYVGMLLAAEGWPGWTVFVWVTVAMVGARTCAMALNRLIDRSIDAANPRTAGRELPTGKLAPRDALLLAGAGLLLLILAGVSLNTLTRNLLPLAVAALVLYSYTKRFTWLCHLWLGTTIGATAAAGWIAVTGSFEPAAWLLWFAVGAWIAGFDVIYAILDVDFDRRAGIHSIPAAFGVPAALRVSAGLHLLSLIGLAAAGALLGLEAPYFAAVAVVAVVLAVAHLLIRSRGPGEALRSFNANLMVAPLILVGVLAQLFLFG